MITGASVALVIGQGVVGIIILCRPEVGGAVLTL